MKKNILATVTVLAVLAVGAYAFAGPGYGQGMGRGQGPGMMMNQGGGNDPGNCPRLGGAAQLTPEQQAQAEALFKAHFEKVAPLRDKLYAKNLELEAALAQETIDQSRIKGLTKDINKLQSQLFEERTSFRAELSKAGIKRFGGRGMGRGYHHGRGKGFGPGNGPGNCPGYGPGNGPNPGQGNNS